MREPDLPARPRVVVPATEIEERRRMRDESRQIQFAGSILETNGKEPAAK